MREELGETCRTVKSIMRNLVCKSRKKDEVRGSDATRQRDETEKGVGGRSGGRGVSGA